MKKKKIQPVEPAIPDNWNNPFVGLKIDLPKEEPKPAPPPEPELPKSNLSKADQELLKAFEAGGISSVGSAERGLSEKGTRGRISFNIQRKGKGGKTVTLVRGLEKLEMLEQMALCSKLKSAMGCGARFDNGILEIQGDQRERAAEWLAGQGVCC